MSSKGFNETLTVPINHKITSVSSNKTVDSQIRGLNGGMLSLATSLGQVRSEIAGIHKHYNVYNSKIENLEKILYENSIGMNKLHDMLFSVNETLQLLKSKVLQETNDVKEKNISKKKFTTDLKTTEKVNTKADTVQTESGNIVQVQDVNNVVQTESGNTVQDVNNVVQTESGNTVQVQDVNNVVQTESGNTVQDVNNVVQTESGNTVQVQDVNNVVQVESGNDVQVQDVNNVVQVENKENSTKNAPIKSSDEQRNDNLEETTLPHNKEVKFAVEKEEISSSDDSDDELIKRLDVEFSLDEDSEDEETPIPEPSPKKVIKKPVSKKPPIVKSKMLLKKKPATKVGAR